MKVLVAGATGVIGAILVPRLAAAGHEVIKVSRASGTDLLDRQAVRQAVRTTEPEAVVHMATAIPGSIKPKTMARDFEPTNRLRAEGTRNLIDAAQETGVRRVIAQGLAYAYQPGKGLATRTRRCGSARHRSSRPSWRRSWRHWTVTPRAC